jgi:Flp pilus assembly protein TadG
MRWTTIWKAEEGSTLVLTAVGMVVIMGFAALAIDVGSLRFARRHLQSAADAAAIAGALEISACNGTSDCAALQTAAQTSLAENGFSGSAVLTNCTGTAGTGLTIMVNNPPCAQVTGDPNSGKAGYVEVVASRAQPTYFASVLGLHSVPISVRAEAAKTPNPNCIYVLDPSGGNAFSVALLAAVVSGCGIVDESSAGNALSCNLLASITASQINVVGGTQSFLCGVSPTPKTGVSVPNPADPLAWLPKPAVPACGTSTVSPFHGWASQPVIPIGNATFYPDGSYCGGITLLPGANVTFMPGTYVLKSVGLQGGLNVNLLASASGIGVTFYNLGPNGGINFLATLVNLGGIDLVAPTTGTYAGILFFQDSQDSAGANIIGSPAFNTVLQGAYYFPNATVTFAASLGVDYNFLVAKDISFSLLTVGLSTVNSSSSFSNNYSSLPGGSPLAGGGSVLVQ